MGIEFKKIIRITLAVFLVAAAAGCRNPSTGLSESGLSGSGLSQSAVSADPTEAVPTGPEHAGIVLKDIPLEFGANEWQFVWAYNVLDQDAGTALLEIQQPVLREAVMTYGEAWEGDGCCYQNFFWDEAEGIYRMYYKGLDILDGDNENFTAGEFKVCYAESTDGVNWEKPDLGLYAYQGSYHNNIIFDQAAAGWAVDNFFVFKDPNPDCRKGEEYKALAGRYPDGLYCYYSSDGIHFDPENYDIITTEGTFDTLNTVHWSESEKKYYCYIRNFHSDSDIRDVRMLTSSDFVTWTSPVMLSYGTNADDYPMYTNNVTPYYRNEKILIGFPTRYMERNSWSNSFEELTGRKERLFRISIARRYGLALTDCAFMTSVDGENWRRYDEALFTPGSENGLNWVYGDCLPAYGMLETPQVIPGADPEISMYIAANHFTGQAKVLYRYTLRVDGFAACTAPYSGAVAVTEDFTCPGGDTLSVNFSTSAMGYLKVSLVTESGDRITSAEHFGDSIDRTVRFSGSRTPESFQGQKVHLEFEMADAKLYSFRFNR